MKIVQWGGGACHLRTHVIYKPVIDQGVGLMTTAIDVLRRPVVTVAPVIDWSTRSHHNFLLPPPKTRDFRRSLAQYAESTMTDTTKAKTTQNYDVLESSARDSSEYSSRSEPSSLSVSKSSTKSYLETTYEKIRTVGKGENQNL